MGQTPEQKKKLTKAERLQKSIDDIGIKIKKLTNQQEVLIKNLIAVQREEILAIVTSEYKTTEEIAEFIKKAKSDNYAFGLINQVNEKIQIEMEEENDFKA